MHAALEANPQYAEFDKRIDDAEVVAAGTIEQDRILAAAYQKALADLAPGDPYPTAPDANAGSGWLFGQRATIRGERTTWIAANYDDIAADIAKAEDALLAKAAKVVADLDKLTAELDDLSSTANFVTMQAQRPPMIRHGAGNETAENLIAAVRSGKYLFREPYAVGGPRLASHVTH